MKYKSFRTIALGVGLASVGVVVFLVGRSCGRTGPTEPRPEPMLGTGSGPVKTPTPAPIPVPVGTQPAPSDGVALREMDQRILTKAAQGITGDKVKDAFPGESWKASLYKDAGFKGVNRAKIDLDRDEKWDEKWTWSTPTEVKRQIAPADDENYTVEVNLRDGRWVGPPGAATSSQPAGPTEVPTGGIALRPMDQEVLTKARQPITGERVKDATAGRPYKVSLYKDAGFTTVNRAKLDLDRDEKWDEKWTFEGEEVKRQVAPADDEQYTDEYRLRGGVWIKK
jgi:hypothetical protein